MIVRRILSLWVLLSFLGNSISLPSAIAQGLLDLPAPGLAVQLSKAYTPTLLNGITTHPENPFRFDFLISTGDSNLEGVLLKQESARLVKYFMASLTVSEQDLWVNLSPYEKNRMVPETFGATWMGRDLLAQDYILKELSSSLIDPEKQLGKEFWQEVYRESLQRYGTTQIPVNTFNKIWIVADSAKIYENGNSAYVVDSKLKVLLQEDLLAMNKNFKQIIGQQAMDQQQVQESNKISSNILRQIIVPAIQREVNEGKNFANLRQVYQSLILATWYKMKLKESLLGKIYVGRNKMDGINDNSNAANQGIYNTYLKAFRKGVFNFVQEDIDPVSMTSVPRKYFSGGLNISQGIDSGGQSVPLERIIDIVGDGSHDAAQIGQEVEAGLENKHLFRLSTAFDPAMASRERKATALKVIAQPYPDPVTHKGENYPLWNDMFLLGQFILREYLVATANDNERHLFYLNDGLFNRAFDFFHARGVSMEREKLLSLFEDLRLRQIVEGGDEKIAAGNKINLMVAPRQLALWSKDVDFIKDDLQETLKEEKNYAGDPEQGPLVKTLEDYNTYVEADELRPTEAKSPVLIAFTLMPKTEQENILNILLNPAIPHLNALADAVALTFAADRLGAGWVLERFPELAGRKIIIVTPELSTFAGGLGRVMKFFTASLKKFGLDVMVIEGKYSSKVKLEDGRPTLVPFDYKDVPVPIHDLKDGKPLEIIYQGRYRKVETSEGINVDQVPIVQLGDGGWAEPNPGEDSEKGLITKALYAYDMPYIGAPKSFVDFSIFFSKSALDYIIMDAVADLRQKGRERYKAPVLFIQDGQALLTGFLLKEFYIDRDPFPPRDVKDTTERNRLIQDMKYVASVMYDAIETTHTYFNTGSQGDLHGIRNRLLQEGIKPEHLHYFLRRSPWGNIALDMSSPGLRTGIATGVSAKHAFDRARNEFVTVVGISNGDFLDYSGEYFNEILKSLYPDFKGEYWEVTRDMLSAIKNEAKKRLGFELGVDINPDMPLIGMAQRGVDEKGWLHVFTMDNVLEVIKKGNLIAEVNAQAYDESRKLVAALESIRKEADRLHALDPNTYKGRFIVRPYDASLQRKTLVALDAQIHAPKLNTGANEMTETNVLRNGGINITPAYLEGMVQAGITFRLPQKPLSQKLLPNEYQLGTTLVNNGDGTQDWLYSILRVQELFFAKNQLGQSTLGEAQLLALQVSRTLSYDATTGDYLRMVQKSTKRSSARLFRHNINGEVSLISDQTKILVNGQEVGHIGSLFTVKGGNNIVMQIAVNLMATDVFDNGKQGIISEDLVHASLLFEGGREIIFRRKNRENGNLIMEAAIPQSQGTLTGKLYVNSGLWNPKDSDLTVIRIKFEKSDSDRAQAVVTPGGILLDPANLKMQVQKDGDGQWEMAGRAMNPDQFKGCHLVLLHLDPVTSQQLQSLFELDQIK